MVTDSGNHIGKITKSNERKTVYQRTSKACDRCRLKKQRCDGMNKLFNICTNCDGLNECTYTGVTAKKNTSSNQVKELEEKLAFYHEFINILAPGFDIDAEFQEYSKGKAPHSFKRKRDNFEMEEFESFQHIDNDYLDYHDTFGSANVLLRKISAYAVQPTNLSSMSQRPEYWKQFHNEDRISSRSQHFVDEDFGTEEMLHKLVHIYFEKVNSTIPLLNKDNFIASIPYRKLDSKFACVLILVCALGALYCDDHKERSRTERFRFLAGNNYLQVYLSRAPDYSQINATLEDIQALILLQMFIQRSSQFKTSWSISGMALVTAVDLGLHLDKGCTNKAQNEPKKRAMWCIYILDRSLCASYGRQPLLKDEDTNLDLPHVLNYEIGTSDHLSVLYFTSMIKLYNIKGKIMKTVYSLRHVNDIMAFKKTVASMYSSLNQWLETLPKECNCSHELTYQLMSNLRISFYNIQIFLYRNFTPNPRSTDSSLFNTQCLMMCVNAARSILSLLKAMEFEKKLIQNYVDVMLNLAPFNAIIVLIFSVCESQNLNQDTKPDLEYIDIGIKVLQRRQVRDIVAGKALDIVLNLLNVCKVPIQDVSSNIKNSHENEFNQDKYMSLENDSNRTTAHNSDIFQYTQSNNSDKNLDDFLRSIDKFDISNYDDETRIVNGTSDIDVRDQAQSHSDDISNYIALI